MNCSFCSTGLNAISYAMARFPSSNEYIVAGVGLKGGSYFYGVGEMAIKRAKVDKKVMKYWSRSKRPNLYTTDQEMSKYGDVPIWNGEVFYYNE